MEINPQAVFNILNIFPGNLVYYLILVYAITTCLLSIWSGSRVNDLPFPFSSFLSLGILLIASLTPLIYLVIVDIFIPADAFVYALLERTSLTLLMVWSAWLWLGPRPSHLITIIAVGISLLIPLITAIIGLVLPENMVGFNTTLADITWHVLSIFAALFFIILILRNKPSIWPYGLGMMLVILVGFSISLAVPIPQSDVSGAARLGILCAFPLLPLIARRYDLAESTAAGPASFDHIMTKASAHAVPDEINAWLAAVSNLDLIRQQEAVARMLGQTLDAQACAFLQLSDRPGVIRVTAGYDLSHQAWIEPSEILSVEFPKTSKSLVDNQLTIIRTSSENAPELSRFADRFKLEGINSAALLPLKNTNIQYGSAVVFRSTSSPSFLMETLQQYIPTAAALAHIFKNNETAIRERQDMIRLAAELDALQVANQTLQENLESLRLSAVQIQPERSTLQMLTLQQASETEIDRLRGENRLLLQTLADENKQNLAEPHINQIIVSEELSLAKAEIARLQNLLQDSRLRLKEMQKQTTISSTSMVGLRKFNTLLTEIRHPLSTITGYVDLMLASGNASLFGASNQISMDNLKASMAKLRQIMDDISDVNVLSSGVIDMEPEMMDLANAIDQAVATISTGYMEKEISLKLNLPATLPFILTYHDALKKVILYLLQNAGKITPRGGSVILRVEVHQESSEPYLLIEVTDHGGGIAATDISKVFSTIEQHQGRIIPGMGELNGGLAASKTLVEAHGGRIWVDSDPGISTTFSVLLPVQANKIM
jgi:signal transduction histidine kinase